jgi:hypothetical protein
MHPGQSFVLAADETMAQLHRARQVHANDPVVHYYLGRVYAAKASNADKLRQAVAAYTTATQADAAFAAAYRELAITYTKLGDSAGAAATRHTFIALCGEMSFLPLPTETGVATCDLPLVTPGLKAPRPYGPSSAVLVPLFCLPIRCS